MTELDSLCCPLDGLTEIRTVKNDGGALSAEFESYVFKIGRSRDLGDLVSGEGAPRERDLGDVGVRGDGVPDSGTFLSNDDG